MKGRLMLDNFFPDMRRRNCSDKEILEIAGVDPRRHQRTVRQFRMINRLFSSSGRLMREYFFIKMAENPERTYTLLDIGAGGGDIAIQAAREARNRGLRLDITMLDNDKRIIPLALHAIRNYPEIRIIEGSAFELNCLSPFDFVFSNHLLHHLTWDEIRAVLENISALTRITFVMNDLKRSSWAYLGFTIFSWLCTPGSYHYHDGRLSIRRAFLPEELLDFLQRNFPLGGISVIETYPSRVVLVHTAGETTQP
jgi:2-polyprenyl-3-methyl-5-hydroxy-6-metoxy-1,4-benzoquinol methylase